MISPQDARGVDRCEEVRGAGAHGRKLSLGPDEGGTVHAARDSRTIDSCISNGRFGRNGLVESPAPTVQRPIPCRAGLRIRPKGFQDAQRSGHPFAALNSLRSSGKRTAASMISGHMGNPGQGWGETRRSNTAAERKRPGETASADRQFARQNVPRRRII